MKITKMTLKWFIFSAFGFLLGIEQAYAACEAEFEAYVKAERLLPTTQNPAELERIARDTFLDDKKNHCYVPLYTTSWTYEEKVKEQQNNIKTNRTNMGTYEGFVFYLCMWTEAIALRDAGCKLDSNGNKISNAKVATSSNHSAKQEKLKSANWNSQEATNNDTSSNTKPLTKAELKAQKAEQEAQVAEQDVQEDTQRAQENQVKADKARQGKRRRHEPENVAHTCISPDFGGLYGALDNTCNYKVWYAFCSYRPKEGSFAAFTNCEKQSFGSDSVGSRKSGAVHTHNLEKIYWFACKDPAWPLDLVFEGDGIRGRCHTVGGE